MDLGLRKSFITQAAGISADDLLNIEYSPEEGKALKNADMCRANLPKCSRPEQEASSRAIALSKSTERIACGHSGGTSVSSTHSESAALFRAVLVVDPEECSTKWSGTERLPHPVSASVENFGSTSGNQGTSAGFHGGDRSKRLEADAHGASTQLPHRPCPGRYSRSKIALSKRTRVDSQSTPTLASTPRRFPAIKVLASSTCCWVKKGS